MFEWLKDLNPGDQVVVRDSSHLITYEGPTENVEVVINITDKHIKTMPLDRVLVYTPMIEPYRLFNRQFGSSNSLQLVRKIV